MKAFVALMLACCMAVVSAVPASRTVPEVVNSVRAATSPSIQEASSLHTLAVARQAGNGTTTGSGGKNIQKFNGTLGGPPPPVIQSSGERPFSVNGDTFVGSSAALGRSCDIQHNKCADAANAGTINAEVEDCDMQNDECHAANNLKKRRFLRDVRPSTLVDERGLEKEEGGSS